MRTKQYQDDPQGFEPQGEEEVDRWYSERAAMDEQEVDEMTHHLFLSEQERAERFSREA